jgi:hypothetical protein
MFISIIAFFTVLVLSSACLNYLNTGNIFKILPGYKARFWTATIALSSVCAALVYLFLSL